MAVLIYLQKESLKIYGVPALAHDTTANLQLRALYFSGKLLNTLRLDSLPLRPDSSHLLWEGSLKKLLDGAKPANTVVEMTLTGADGTLFSRRLFYALPPRKLNLPNAKVNLTVEAVSGGYLLLVETGSLAKNVYLGTEAEGFFDDNYFDLLPGTRKAVLFRTEQVLDNPQEAFRVKHLAGACE